MIETESKIRKFAEYYNEIVTENRLILRSASKDKSAIKVSPNGTIKSRLSIDKCAFSKQKVSDINFLIV